MSFKSLMKKLFDEEDSHDDAPLMLGLMDFSIKMSRGVSKTKDGNTCFDLKRIATDDTKVYIMNGIDNGSGEKKAFSYLGTLTKKELWAKYNEMYLLQEISKNSFHDYFFPDPDHPHIFYFAQPSDFMKLVQKDIISRRS